VSLIGKIEEAADEDNWDGANDHSMNASYMDRSKMEISFGGGGGLGSLGGGRSRANLDVSINKLDVSRSKDKYLNVSKSK